MVITEITWTDYLKFKAKLRGFNLESIEEIILVPVHPVKGEV